MITEPSALTPAQKKLLATLTAEFSLRGYEVHQLPDGGVIVARWGFSKFCPGPGLDALRNFARQVGVTT